MATVNKGGFCPNCQQQRMGSKQVLGGGWGCILSLLTGGLFFPFWIAWMILDENPRPFICNVCGTALKDKAG